jgi:3-isopropylmalate/(R)-2-methylmalate dehydratase small subunit
MEREAGVGGVQQVTGRAVALDRRDVDTDQIIPASWLKRVERTGFEAGLFGAWRNDQAVVSSRFADIFRGNCISSGLVPVEASEQAVAALFAALAADPDAEVTVDVAARTVGIPSAGLTEPFTIADFAQWRLLEGLDDVALTLRYEDAISAYEATRVPWLPASAVNEPAGA